MATEAFFHPRGHEPERKMNLDVIQCIEYIRKHYFMQKLHWYHTIPHCTTYDFPQLRRAISFPSYYKKIFDSSSSSSNHQQRKHFDDVGYGHQSLLAHSNGSVSSKYYLSGAFQCTTAPDGGYGFVRDHFV